jgi:hypothetical protein
VRFQNGELTIEAQNATLAQILRAVQSQTGASVDIPSSANNERVATTIGPGQPSVVLNTLLNGRGGQSRRRAKGDPDAAVERSCGDGAE